LEKKANNTVNEAAAEEILTLQDEINRLNQELSRSQSEEDPNSPEALVKRYEELRRLAEAALEKDKEIASLRERLDKLSDDSDGGRPSELSNNSEADGMRQYITELQQELQQLRGDGREKASKPRVRSFLSRNGSKATLAREELEVTIADLEEKVNDKEVEIEALREVNEMLRVDVEKSRKRMKELEDDLSDERERSKAELKAFGKTLRGVDELREAAESMNHKLKMFHEKQHASQPIQFLDEVAEEDALGEEHLEEATRIIDSARTDLENKEQQAKDRPPPFWNIDFRQKPTNDEDTSDLAQRNEEDIQKIVAAKAAKRKKKKKRRGSGSSIVSSFF